MPIKIMKVKNFKSIKDLELQCRKINIFIGEPNTGKSNILEAIGLLSFSSYGTGQQGGAGQLGEFVRYERMTDLFYDHVLADPITISCDERALKIRFLNGKFYGGYCPNPSQTIDFFSLDYVGVTKFSPNEPFQCFKFYRFFNHRSFPSQDSEFLKPPNGKNLMSIIMTNKRIKELTREIFGKFGYRLIVRPEESKIEMAKESEDVLISFPYFLASETLQRLIFYIAAINSNQKSTITLEEPEAHAFPFYTKYLAERIALGNGDNQYFIATHNPYFLASILEKSPKENVAIFITYLDHYQTKARLLVEAEKERILEMGPEDVFFNIDKFLNLKD